jgi:hypothetical protein
LINKTKTGETPVNKGQEKREKRGKRGSIINKLKQK